MEPSVLFVCVSNGGKSQIAAALLRQLGGVSVSSAGTRPGAGLNEEAATHVAARGASMAGQQPRALTADEVAAADRVIVLGREAKVDPVPGMRGSIEVWDIDEPSLRGIDGAERMELIVSEIATRVEALHAQLAQQAATPHIRVFEPALCCNTGVCGTDVDDALVAFTADLEHLKGQGVDIERHNLANDPTAFAATPAVSAYLQMAGSAGLPLVLVDDVTVATGRYPDRAELRRYAGLSPAAAGVGLDLGLVEAESSSSCSPASGCC